MKETQEPSFQTYEPNPEETVPEVDNNKSKMASAEKISSILQRSGLEEAVGLRSPEKITARPKKEVKPEADLEEVKQAAEKTHPVELVVELSHEIKDQHAPQSNIESAPLSSKPISDEPPPGLTTESYLSEAQPETQTHYTRPYRTLPVPPPPILQKTGKSLYKQAMLGGLLAALALVGLFLVFLAIN